MDMRATPRLTLSLNGFTLLEVILSISIFLLLAGGIFASVAVTTSTANEVALVRLESERGDSMEVFMRHLFSNLSGAARLELRVRPQDSRGQILELLISESPDFANFSANQTQAGGLAIAAVPDGRGAYTISLANFDSQLSADERNKQLQAAAWIALLPDVGEMRWRFAENNTSGLQETWTANNQRPGLADLQIAMKDGSSLHWQFRIPNLEPLAEGVR